MFLSLYMFLSHRTGWLAIDILNLTQGYPYADQWFSIRYLLVLTLQKIKSKSVCIEQRNAYTYGTYIL